MENHVMYNQFKLYYDILLIDLSIMCMMFDIAGTSIAINNTSTTKLGVMNDAKKKAIISASP